MTLPSFNPLWPCADVTLLHKPIGCTEVSCVRAHLSEEVGDQTQRLQITCYSIYLYSGVVPKGADCEEL
jgi:hypothetical protein